MSNLQPLQFPIPEGFEVVTRSGEKVTQLTKFDTVSHLSLRGVLGKSIESWVENGKWNQVDAHSDYDLFLRPIPRERWVVVVQRNESNWAGPISSSEESAEISKENMQIAYPDAKVSIHKITLP